MHAHLTGIKSSPEQSRAIKSNQEQSTASMKPSTWAWAQRTLNGTWTLVLERASSMEINGDQWRSMEINGDRTWILVLERASSSSVASDSF